MTASRVEFTVVLDSVGDPRVYDMVGLRCKSTSCNRLLRGDCVRIGTEVFHKGCAPKSTPDPARWRKPSDGD